MENLPITHFCIHGNHEQRPQTIVMGRAYSIDKMIRLMYGYGWWPDEIEDKLEYQKWYCGH